MTTKSRATIRITRSCNASPERWFDAWVDPERAWTWMARTTGEVVRIEIEPRVHGAVRQVVRRDGRELEHAGEYIELARPRRLAFTWAGPAFCGERCLVSMDFVAAGTGTELTLVHERVLQGHESRTTDWWTTILEAISVALGRPAEPVYARSAS